MSSKSRYVFGAAVAGMAFSGVPALLHKASGAIVTNADFTFESSNSVFSSSGTSSTTNSTASPSSGSYYLYGSYTGSSVGVFNADSGTGSAIGVHASTATVWSLPVGSGSQKSLSANHWVAGDYYQFTVPTTGIDGILISFDQTSSGTGPKAFSLTYSVGGASGVAAAYTVGTVAFSASATNTANNYSFNLSSIPGLNEQSSVVFDLVDADSPTNTAGANRIDNFTVSGTGTSVPEPAGLSLLTAAGAATFYRKRRNRA